MKTLETRILRNYKNDTSTIIQLSVIDLLLHAQIYFEFPEDTWRASSWNSRVTIYMYSRHNKHARTKCKFAIPQEAHDGLAVIFAGSGSSAAELHRNAFAVPLRIRSEWTQSRLHTNPWEMLQTRSHAAFYSIMRIPPSSKPPIPCVPCSPLTHRVLGSRI